MATTLGNVKPGDYATLGDGSEVMVSWHQSTATAVRRDGSAPFFMASDTVVMAVRERQRTRTDVETVSDPLSGTAEQQLEATRDGLPLFSAPL